MTAKTRVAIVDDDESIRRMVELALNLHGQATVSFADGLELVSQMQAGLRPGLILLDLRMPGLSGAELIEVLRHTVPNPPPIVLVTADIQGCEIADKLRANGCLQKPVGIETLVKTVEKWVVA